MKTSVVEMLDTLSDDDYVNVARVRRRLQVNGFHLTVQITPESNKTQIPVVFIKQLVIEQEVRKRQCAHVAPSCWLAVETLSSFAFSCIIHVLNMGLYSSPAFALC